MRLNAPSNALTARLLQTIVAFDRSGSDAAVPALAVHLPPLWVESGC
jgi:hypothetical protein